MKKNIFIWILVLIVEVYAIAQPPAGYYLEAEGKTGIELKAVLHDIIKNHTAVSYSELWTYFISTDASPDGKVWDMYSDKPGQTPPYVYTFISDQCGTYSKEGDCYNREHSFPNSWFGGNVMPMYTDLFHIYPTDGYVNNKRANYPYGKVSSATWTSLNGSKLGTCGWPGYNGVVFEPIDAYKGDFARSILYMAVRYYTEDAGWPGSDMVTGAEPKEWAVTLLLNWHNADPVSEKEINRNNTVYGIQGNRNPFIDNPAFAELIWGNQNRSSKLKETYKLPVFYPVPAREKVTITFPFETAGDLIITFHSINGIVIMSERYPFSREITVNTSNLSAGLYIIVIVSKEKSYHFLVPVIK